MTKPAIICSNSKLEIKLTKLLAAPLLEYTRRQFEQQLARDDSDIAQREQAMRDREKRLAEARQAQAELLKKQRELDDTRRELDPTVERACRRGLPRRASRRAKRPMKNMPQGRGKGTDHRVDAEADQGTQALHRAGLAAAAG